MKRNRSIKSSIKIGESYGLSYKEVEINYRKAKIMAEWKLFDSHEEEEKIIESGGIGYWVLIYYKGENIIFDGSFSRIKKIIKESKNIPVGSISVSVFPRPFPTSVAKCLYSCCQYKIRLWDDQ